MQYSSTEQKDRFSIWVTENLGEKTGTWYSLYLEQLGTLLNKFELDEGKQYHTNFFEYQDYKEFEQIYISITHQDPTDLSDILAGKRKRYPESYVDMKLTWNKKYAQYYYENGERSNPNDFGGIADIGVILRAYLKFLYYTENASLVYPKKEKKTAIKDGEIDDSVNYWMYAPGEDARMWKAFYQDGVMGLGWDYLGDLNQYQSRTEVEKSIAEYRKGGVRPTNDSKAVWDFYKEIKPGDIVYAKSGLKRIIGRGIVTGHYFFDSEAAEYPHRHKVNWTNEGCWELREQVAMKTLTNFNF